MNGFSREQHLQSEEKRLEGIKAKFEKKEKARTKALAKELERRAYKPAPAPPRPTLDELIAEHNNTSAARLEKAKINGFTEDDHLVSEVKRLGNIKLRFKDREDALVQQEEKRKAKFDKKAQLTEIRHLSKKHNIPLPAKICGVYNSKNLVKKHLDIAPWDHLPRANMQLDGLRGKDQSEIMQQWISGKHSKPLARRKVLGAVDSRVKHNETYLSADQEILKEKLEELLPVGATNPIPNHRAVETPL